MTHKPTEWLTSHADGQNTGHHPNATGPTETVEQHWRIETELPVYTQPILVDGTLYVGDNAGMLRAIDPQTGVVDWRFQAPEQIGTPPVVTDDTVYVGNTAIPEAELDGTEVGGRDVRTAPLQAVDAASGSVLRAAGDLNSVVSLSWIDDSLLVVTKEAAIDGGGAVHRIAMDSLVREWTTQFEHKIHTEIAVDDGTIFVGDDWNRVTALDASRGERLWTVQCEPEPEDWLDTTSVSGLAVTDDTVIATTGGCRLTALERTTGDCLWTVERPFLTGPAVAGETVYVGSRNGFDALTLESGTERWHRDCPDRVAYEPSVVDGTVYFTSGHGSTALYAVDATTGDLLWEHSFGEQTDADLSASTPPTVSEEHIYLGTCEEGIRALAPDVR